MLNDERLKEICAELLLIADRKNHDYGDDNILMFGEKGIVIRLYDKMNRLKTLLIDKGDNVKTKAEFESIEDTCRDLALYAMYIIMLREGTFVKRETENIVGGC